VKSHEGKPSTGAGRLAKAAVSLVALVLCVGAGVAPSFAEDDAVSAEKTWADVEAWISEWDGKMIGGGECVDLFNSYGAMLGLSHVNGNGWQIYDNAPASQWEKLGEGIVPRHGDVAVWNQAVGHGNGHVAVVIDHSGDTLGVFQQNWPDGTAAHRQAGMSRVDVIGFLRPRNLQ
jgi:hypothetical protein